MWRWALGLAFSARLLSRREGVCASFWSPSDAHPPVASIYVKPKGTAFATLDRCVQYTHYVDWSAQMSTVMAQTCVWTTSHTQGNPHSSSETDRRGIILRSSHTKSTRMPGAWVAGESTVDPGLVAAAGLGVSSNMRAVSRSETPGSCLIVLDMCEF